MKRSPVMALFGMTLMFFCFIFFSRVAFAAKGGGGPSGPTNLNCSAGYAGDVVINEIQTEADFIELYVMQESDINNWSLYVDDTQEFVLGVGSCEINGTSTKDNQSGGATSTTWPAGTFITCDTNMNPSNNEVLLVDKTSALSEDDATVIDYLSYGKPSPSAKWTMPEECGSLFPDHDASEKDIVRAPDGVGDWGDNGNNNTKGRSNTGYGGGESPLDDFNCVATGSDPSTGTLYTRLVNNGFAFDVVAFDDTGALKTDYSDTVTIELVDTSSGNCTSYSSVSSNSITFTDGEAVSPSWTLNQAYRSLACRVTDSVNAIQACSTDSFSVRPESFVLDATGINNSGSSGSPTQVAGTNFNLSVASAAGYDGNPSADLSAINAHAGAVTTGLLSGAFNAADPSTGSATGTFTYDEVGNFRFDAEAIYDDSFTSVDQPGDCTDDFSNTEVGGKIGCKFATTLVSDWIGRFIPDHFTLAVQDEGSLDPGCATGAFSYAGQDITWATEPILRLTAENSAGNQTENYTADYAKLDLASFVLPDVTSDASQLGVDSLDKVTLSWSLGTPSLNDNGDGTHDFSLGGDAFTYGRTANDLVAPFTTDIDIQVASVSDSDSVNAIAVPVTFNPAGISLMHGRLAMNNAHGSELEDLNIPMAIEYYNGPSVDFVTNSLDTCSSVSVLSISDTDTTDSLSASDTCIWDDDAETGGLACSADASKPQYSAMPANGIFDLNLKAPGTGKTGSLTLSAAVDPWLQYDWLGAGEVDPEAMATFGIFQKKTKIIYQREVR